MGKSRNCDRDHTETQRLRIENKKLKSQVSSLRKQLARLDLDRYDTVKEMIEEYREEEQVAVSDSILDKMVANWACKEPGCEGHLEIILYNKMGDTYYFRKCSKCINRTKSQKYSATVRGPRKETEEITNKR